MSAASSDVQVYLRVRPSPSASCLSSITPTAVVAGCGKTAAEFTFDRVFDQGSTQAGVFGDVGAGMTQACLEGFNTTIFAYGQTGAGKTFTMYGPKERFPDGREDPRRPIVPLRGVVPRTLEEVFATKETMKDTHTVTVLGSMIELYRNDLRDLIVQRKDGQPPEKLNCRLDKGVVIVVGMHEEEVHNPEELLEIMTSGMENRKVAATSMNPDSSRSHCMFIVKFISVNKETQEKLTGKILMIDLAGSERLKKSEVSGDGQKEAIEINKSLTALGDVIQALTGKAKQVPYRNHQLTQVMQDALGGTAKTLMFVNLSPAMSNADETIMTLKWAQRAKKITNTSAKAKAKAKA